MTMLAVLLNLTLREVLADLPHDAGAVVVYTLILISGVLIWRGSRTPQR